MISLLEELNDVIQGPALRTIRPSSSVAQRDDRHNCLVFWNVEEFAQFVSVTHSHDERIEAHSASLQNQVAVAQTIVVGAPSVAYLIRLVTLKEARLTPLKR